MSCYVLRRPHIRACQPVVSADHRAAVVSTTLYSPDSCSVRGSRIKPASPPAHPAYTHGGVTNGGHKGAIAPGAAGAKLSRRKYFMTSEHIRERDKV